MLGGCGSIRNGNYLMEHFPACPLFSRNIQEAAAEPLLSRQYQTTIIGVNTLTLLCHIILE